MSKNNSSNSAWQTDQATLFDSAFHSIRIAIVVSTYNSNVTQKLQIAAGETAIAAGILPSNIETLLVPGAWELPLACALTLKEMQMDAVVALGCVIRGETSHDQHINRAVSTGLMNLSIKYRKPVGFGLLTVDTLDQALARAGGDAGNKGAESMQAVLQMLRLRIEHSKN